MRRDERYTPVYEFEKAVLLGACGLAWCDCLSCGHAM